MRVVLVLSFVRLLFGSACTQLEMFEGSPMHVPSAAQGT
jgi:hypothetical protein